MEYIRDPQQSTHMERHGKEMSHQRHRDQVFDPMISFLFVDDNRLAD